MIKSLSEKTKKETPWLNTLKVLLQSLKYQLEKLNETNEKIEKINNELNGGLYQEKKREAVKNFAGPGKNSKLNE